MKTEIFSKTEQFNILGVMCRRILEWGTTLNRETVIGVSKCSLCVLALCLVVNVQFRIICG